tara:strand:- start:837 stop:1304 length:468 start_codon:yes stop_codon:yes gene_type:complete
VQIDQLKKAKDNETLVLRQLPASGDINKSIDAYISKLHKISLKEYNFLVRAIQILIIKYEKEKKIGLNRLWIRLYFHKYYMFQRKSANSANLKFAFDSIIAKRCPGGKFLSYIPNTDQEDQVIAVTGPLLRHRPLLNFMQAPDYLGSDNPSGAIE